MIKTFLLTLLLLVVYLRKVERREELFGDVFADGRSAVRIVHEIDPRSVNSERTGPLGGV